MPHIVLLGPQNVIVGTTATWTATVNEAPPAGPAVLQRGARSPLQFRWQITLNGKEIVYRDFNTVTAISLIPPEDGTGTVTLTARDPVTFNTQTVTANLTATWPAALTGSSVIPSPNPLVALYRTACIPGHSIGAIFAPAANSLSSGMVTSPKPCTQAGTVTFTIAGMTASTPYLISSLDTATSTTGDSVPFTSGLIPPSAQAVLPSLTVTGITTAPEKIVVESVLGATPLPSAFDATGNIVWYNYPPAVGGIAQLMRVLPGGNFILAQQNGLLQEIDLLGNILRETNIARVNEQILASPWSAILTGAPARIADFNHDGFPLPDGSLATLSVVEKMLDQGDGKGVVDVLADVIMVLDPEWQLTWAWNPYDHLDITRKATLNDVCASLQTGCPLLRLVPAGATANDWMHANAISTTNDGNFLLSIRNQDWIVKIDYLGRTGNILWRFGQAGDFSASGDPSEPVLFPSHQHDASLSGSRLMLFDNANGTFSALNGSRGQVWNIDEKGRTAYLQNDARMNVFSGVVGSARTLQNGNLYFLAGFISATSSQSIEFTNDSPYAKPLATFTLNNSAYRSFRMTDLYTPSNP